METNQDKGPAICHKRSVKRFKTLGRIMFFMNFDGFQTLDWKNRGQKMNQLQFWWLNQPLDRYQPKGPTWRWSYCGECHMSVRMALAARWWHDKPRWRHHKSRSVPIRRLFAFFIKASMSQHFAKRPIACIACLLSLLVAPLVTFGNTPTGFSFLREWCPGHIGSGARGRLT